MFIDIACGIKEDETGGKARLKTMTVPSASPTTPNRPALTRKRGNAFSSCWRIRTVQTLPARPRYNPTYFRWRYAVLFLRGEIGGGDWERHLGKVQACGQKRRPFSPVALRCEFYE